MRTALVALTLLLAAPAAVSAVSSPNLAAPLAQDGGTHKDERFGFKFKPPKKWRSIALKTDETWLVAKYLCEKADIYHDKNLGYTFEHKPELMLIAFQHENQNRKREVTEEEEDGVKVTTITISNPYKDYEDFLERTYAGGGWFIEKTSLDDDKTYTVGDIEYEWYEIKVEKSARTGPKRIITWLFKTDDIDYAMQIEVLDYKYKGHKKVLERSLKSFEEIERNGDLLPKNGATGDAIRITRKELTSGSPKERRTVRMKSQRELHDKAIANLPEDWDHKYYGDVLILEHNQDKWAKRLGEHLELLLKFMEDEFAYIGDGEYARAPVVRVCDDPEEAMAFSRGVTSGTSGGWRFLFPGSELITYKDDAGWIGYQVEDVNRNVLMLWLMERDEDLTNALPEWVQIGVLEFIGGARRDGRKLDFRVDQSDYDAARLAVAQKRNTPVRDILRFTREEFASNTSGVDAETYWSNRAEATMFVRWLLLKDSDRTKQAKGLLEKYLSTMGAVLTELKEKENDSWASEDAPKNEQEEEDRARQRAERWRSREKELMEETFNRCFADWTDKDWDALQKGYLKWLK